MVLPQPPGTATCASSRRPGSSELYLAATEASVTNSKQLSKCCWECLAYAAEASRQSGQRVEGFVWHLAVWRFGC